MSLSAGPAAPSHPLRARAGRVLEIAMSLYGAAIFTTLWVGLAVGLATDGQLPADAWAWLTGLETVAAVVTWVLILPIGVGLWAWNEAGSTLVFALVSLGLVGWTLIVIDGFVKTFLRR